MAAKVELIAKRAGHYPMRVKVGERFKVSRGDARVLVAVGAATPAPQPVIVKPHPGPPLPKRQYLRRDMKAMED